MRAIKVHNYSWFEAEVLDKCLEGRQAFKKTLTKGWKVSTDGLGDRICEEFYILEESRLCLKEKGDSAIASSLLVNIPRRIDCSGSSDSHYAF